MAQNDWRSADLFIVDLWRLGWDGLQGAFAANIGNICKKPKSEDRSSQVITGRRN